MRNLCRLSLLPFLPCEVVESVPTSYDCLRESSETVSLWLHAASLAHFISMAVGSSLHCFANRVWCTVKAQPVFDER